MDPEEPYASFVNKSVELFARNKDFTVLRGEGETRGDISRFFRQYFPHCSGKLYNAYRWGDLMVVMLDGGESKADGDPSGRITNLGMFNAYREEQARWLAEVIESEAYQTAKYRIVFSHFPVTNETLSEEEAGTAHFAQVMLPVLNKGNVDLLVAGHRHPEGYTLINKGSKGNEFPVLVQGYNFGARIDIVDEKISIVTAGGTVKTKVKKLKR
ncbi:MAG: metallophosphoesterase family protein, partial [Bacteroidaceae bacterium]